MFKAKEEKEKIINFIQDYYQKNNLGGVVIGISGGKDSAVVAGLFTEAIGKENVIGVTLPCHSNPEDQKDALIISNYYGFKMINVDLTSTYDTLTREINQSEDFTEEDLRNSNINLKPRLRMATLYYLAARYTAKIGKTYIVAGTGNKCEMYVGYFTKGGDGVSDINVLADLTVDEVIKIGEILDVPREVLYKPPNDGLGKETDEEKLGVKYEDITRYINGENLDAQTKRKIKRLHEASLHKFNISTYQK